MEYKGIVFFDYDGTLTDEHEKIFTPTEKTKKSIGIICVFRCFLHLFYGTI